ncbi:MAG: ABC transporter ATP-binding protein [Thermodesulfovibrionales bacterium]|nr:ABC transporter ATP-binding protein [Thermodesulfovibrionales bacterium]
MDTVLVAEGLNTFYGKSHILFDVSLKVNRQETLCLMGRNGAGKSTTFKTLVAVLKPRSGKILFNGIDITKKKPYEVARLGLSLVPEDRRIFPTLTVKENLLMGASTHRKGIWNLDMVFEFFPVLKDYQSRLGGNLSGGEQQMLTIARTLMGNPEVILLDEPSEGLSPVMVSTLKDLIIRLKSVGSTIILSEQNVKFAQSVSDRVVIIDKGSICYESDIETFKKNEEIKKAYLAV